MEPITLGGIGCLGCHFELLRGASGSAFDFGRGAFGGVRGGWGGPQEGERGDGRPQWGACPQKMQRVQHISAIAHKTVFY